MRKITLMIAFSLLGSYINLKAANCDSLCANPGDDLIFNGDFEAGNYGFSSSYNFSPIAGDGNYGITQNAGTQVAGQWCNNVDHSSGSGSFLWVDGASTQQAIWEQSISVNPNTDYNFSFYAMNLSVPYSGGINEFVDVYINGTLVEGNLSINDADCFWKQLCVSWQSSNNTSATIEIRNTNTHFMGNDLAFDDITFRECGVVVIPPVCDPLSCVNPGANLLTNGDFEFGDYGFSSAYNLSTSAGDGNYGITQNAYTQVANQWCNNVDHSSGTGNFLWVDGASVQQTIWQQSISVNPNTDYNFSFYAMNLSVPYSGGINEFVDVYINGALVAGGLSINDADCFWKQLCVNWNSANDYYATIEIRNTNTHFMGNDLAFDDITFRQCGVVVIPPVCDPTVCVNPGNDLVLNGGFENGNIDFSSAYTFSPTAGDGNYGITQNAGTQVASQWCNNVDHSSGTGNFLWVDGANTQQAIWQQTVTVSANTDYNFSFWAMNLSVPYSGGINEFVDVYINGTLVAGNLSINDADCTWKQLCVNWNSANSFYATIEIRNTNTHYMGNDLAFDDISFRTCDAKNQNLTAIKAVAAIETKINSYPNPTRGIINFATTDNNETITNIKVYDMVSKLIVSVDNSTSINLENYTDGVYYALIKTSKSTYSQKVVVAKD